MDWVLKMYKICDFYVHCEYCTNTSHAGFGQHNHYLKSRIFKHNFKHGLKQQDHMHLADDLNSGIYI